MCLNWYKSYEFGSYLQVGPGLDVLLWDQCQTSRSNIRPEKVMIADIDRDHLVGYNDGNYGESILDWEYKKRE